MISNKEGHIEKQYNAIQKQNKLQNNYKIWGQEH